MIEAAIVGRPVFTIAAAEFSGGQQGTLHYWYLLVENGGIVSATFPPASRTTSTDAMSATGKGRPRSIPKARVRAAAALGEPVRIEWYA